MSDSPHESRSGLLRNGNPRADLSALPRCLAKTRRGTPCKRPALPNGRCRLHGGLSTGAKTAEGIERIRLAVKKHGMYSAAAKEERRYYRKLLADCRATLRAFSERERANQ
jgi:hypothetical protein